MNLETKGVQWRSFKIWFNLILIRNSVMVWDRFPVLNNLWRFVSLKDFPSTVFVYPLRFYLSFSSGILVTEKLSAYSTLVLLSTACHICAMTQDSADCDATEADVAANCLPVAGGWEAQLQWSHLRNIGFHDRAMGQWEFWSLLLPTSCGVLLLSDLSALSCPSSLPH